MHQLRIANHNKPARIAAACSDETEFKARQKANRHGVTLSQYVDSLIESDIASQADLQDKPLITLSYHLHEDMRKALADGKFSQVEREDITDHVSDLLSGVRKRA